RAAAAAAALMLTAVTSQLGAQSAAELSEDVRNFVSVDAPVVALTNATVIDGTGSAPRTSQTVLIRDGRIAAMGGDVAVPSDAHVVDLTGHTVIPGIVGIHNHLFYTAAGGRAVQMSFTG